MKQLNAKMLQETATLIQNARVRMNKLKNQTIHYEFLPIRSKFDIACQHYLDKIGVYKADLVWDENGELTINVTGFSDYGENLEIEKTDENNPVTVDNIKYVKLKLF